ncbi:MAG: FtsX-like permease family protein [Spirochaetota bacterium]|nr:FtsX-like permease family protein [Spirochaetota bacterium]
MKYELFIALRYLKSRKADNFISRISVIGVVIVSMAVMIPMITMSVMNGFHESIKEKHINKDYHIQIRRGQFVNHKKVMSEIINHPKLNDKIDIIVPFYRGIALIKHQTSKYFGVMIRGIDRDFYKKDKSFQEHFPLIAGNYDVTKSFRIVIGDKLAQYLNPNREDYLNFVQQVKSSDKPIIDVLVSQHKTDNSDKITERFTVFRLKVSGIFRSGYMEYDNSITFTSLRTSQILFNAKIKDGDKRQKFVTGLGIKLFKRSDTGFVWDIINKSYDEMSVYTWIAWNRKLLHAFEWEKTLMTFILIIMIIATVIVTVYINLNIIVMDKKREIGILKSFGVGNGVIQTIFILEGFLIGIVGSGLGGLVSLLFIMSLTDIIMLIESSVNGVLSFTHSAIYGMNKAYIPWEFFSGGLKHIKAMIYKINYTDLYLLCALAIFMCMIAAYFPARKSTRETISSVIRYE